MTDDAAGSAGRVERRVYFLRAGDGLIKIGSSIKTARRIRELQAGNGTELVLLGTVPGGFAREAALHRELAADRLLGEWFAPTETVAETVGRCLGEEHQRVVQTQVLGREPEPRRLRPEVLSQREQDRLWAVEAVDDWWDEEVTVTGATGDRVTAGQAAQHLQFWLAHEGQEPRGSRTAMRTVIEQRMVAAGLKRDWRDKAWIGVRLG